MIPEATFHFAGLLAQAVPLDPGPHNILHPGAPQGSHIEWLYWFIFWITFAVYVLMILGFTRAGAKSRVLSREPLPVSEYPEGDRRAKWAVGAAVAITVITLFVVLGISVATGKRVAGMTTSKNPVTINIIGHQWWWEVNYPNPQADQTVTTAHEIHVPVGTPVVVLTNSAHVFHSSWPPSITGKFASSLQRSQVRHKRLQIIRRKRIGGHASGRLHALSTTDPSSQPPGCI